jgi:hypothetical protein
VVSLSHFFYTNVAYLVVLAVLSFISISTANAILRSHRGIAATITCVAFNVVW